MPMRHADSGTPQISDQTQRRIEVRQAMQEAINAGNQDAFSRAFEDMCQLAAADVRAEYEQRCNGLQETIDDLTQTIDRQVLLNRGVQELTSEERTYWQEFGKAAAAANARQALENLTVAMPRTVISRVFEDLTTNHPLLSQVNFIDAGYATEFIYNENAYQEAKWGELCDEDVKALTSGFKMISLQMFLLSAVIPLCKGMLDLGPEWLDNYVRSIMYEAYANGWEAGIVSGSGKNQPIGMDKTVGKDAVVADGVYAAKDTVAITDFSPATMGGLMGRVAVSANGNSREVKRPILVVPFSDYYTKVYPATTLMTADGTFRENVIPFGVKVVPSAALKVSGQARFGDAARYLALAGSPKDGMVTYSDHEKFSQGKRMYLVNGYGTGMPMDNNAFVNVDISGLKPATYQVQLVEQPA